MKEKAICFKNVTEKYRVKFIIDHKEIWEDFCALQDISFEVEKGDIVGIVGENGAGKTTLLKMIAGLLKPERGEVRVNGRVLGVIEPTIGLQREMTGRENIYLNASLFGLKKWQVDNLMEQIVDFSGIGKFIDAQTNVYSQGMLLRLVFSIVIHMEADILLIDDLITVGDEDFQKKCIKKFSALKENGKTIIFVTHDLATANNFCSKGLFLKNGRLISAGQIDKVLNHYQRTIGDRNGVAILQISPLEAIFNNGRLLLQWEDKVLTKHYCGYSTLAYAEKWFCSFEAKWTVKLVSSNELIAIGKWSTLPVEQQWRIKVVAGADLELEVETKSAVTLRECMIGLMVSSDYTNWLTLEGAGVLPSLLPDKKNWEVINCSKTKIIGLNSSAEKLPVIIFDVADSVDACCELFQTGEDLGSRVFQVEIPRAEDLAYAFSGKVKIARNVSEAKDYIKARHDKNILRLGGWEIVPDMNSIRIFWQDREVLKSPGFYTHFSYNGKKYFSTQTLPWVIEKKGETLSVTLHWDGLPFRQIWEIKIGKDDSIDWDVELDADIEVSLENREIGVLIRGGYAEWFTDAEKGEFYPGKSDASFQKYKNNIIGIKSCCPQKKLFAAVLFANEDSLPRLSYISKNNIGDDADIKLSYLSPDVDKYARFLKGKNNYFRGMLKIFRETNNDAIFIKSRPCKSGSGQGDYVIKSKNLALLFNNGKGCLFWKGEEITKGLGVYTSLYSGGHWRDSVQAYWEIKDKDKTKMILKGYWAHIPVKQLWQFELIDKNTISWKVEMESQDGLKFNREEINLMLSDKYQEWVVNSKRGRFPQEFNGPDASENILRPQGDCGPIGANKCRCGKGFFRKKHVPFVAFSCSGNNGYLHIAGNSEAVFGARLLQYIKIDDNDKARKIMSSVFFEGQIRVWE